MPTDLTGQSLLAVLAHPDDESLACGGLLAWCAELGVEVSLLCVTDGEHGQENNRALIEPSGDLRDIRTNELRAATRVLGVTNFLQLHYEDGMLRWIDSEQLETDIGHAIRRLHPDVVITFGEDGLYWHPDHITVHERTTAAVASINDTQKPPALYYVTMPPGAMRAVVNNAVDSLDTNGISHEPPAGLLGVSDADAFGALAGTPTLVVETNAFATRKLAAIKCHISQLRGSALALMEERDAPRLLGTEHYRRAEVGSRGNTFIERFGFSFYLDSTTS